MDFPIIPSTIHNINNTTTINKLSSFLWYNFHIFNNNIPEEIINFLHLKILSNQMCVHLWSSFKKFKLPWKVKTVWKAKTASNKIGALIHSMRFLSPEVAHVYLYKSTMQPCMEYCCHVWAGAPSCYLKLLHKLQKWICRTFGLSFAASLEPLAHCRNVASLSLFCRYYFG